MKGSGPRGGIFVLFFVFLFAGLCLILLPETRSCPSFIVASLLLAAAFSIMFPLVFSKAKKAIKKKRRKSFRKYVEKSRRD
jgi:fucose permease